MTEQMLEAFRLVKGYIKAEPEEGRDVVAALIYECVGSDPAVGRDLVMAATNALGQAYAAKADRAWEHANKMEMMAAMFALRRAPKGAKAMVKQIIEEMDGKGVMAWRKVLEEMS